MGGAIHGGTGGGDPGGTAERLPASDASRRSHDAPGVLAHHQALFEKGRGRQGIVAAHLEACVCHPFVESWRGFARGPDAPRSQLPVYDADLYALRPCAPERPPGTAPAAASSSPTATTTTWHRARI